MLIVNKAREAAACAEANCASSFTNATNAATSATNAANSATAAAASAAAAATSETNTENLWEQFNALYLGSFAVAPTVDNQGNPLQEGALYWNSVTNEMFVWNGSAWTPDAFNQFTNFTATGTTTARNLVTRMADVVNVKDFGAVGDGVADDTSAIEDAINFLLSSPNKNTLLFNGGNYVVTRTLPIIGQANKNFIGDGATIIFDSTTSELFKLNGPNPSPTRNIVFDGITIKSTNPKSTGDSVFQIYNCMNVVIRNCNFLNQYRCIKIEFCQYVKILNCEFDVVKIGIQIGTNALRGGDGFILDNLRFNGTYNATYEVNTIAISFNSGGGLSISNTDVTKFQYGIYISPKINSYAAWFFMSTTSLDSCEIGLFANNNQGGYITTILIDASCWFASNEVNGIRAYKTSLLKVTGANIFANRNAGIYLDDCDQVSINSSNITQNNVSNSGSVESFPGIFVRDTIGLLVTGCSFVNDSSLITFIPAYQKNGIILYSGNKDCNIISNNFVNHILEDISIYTVPIGNNKIKNNTTTKSPNINSSNTISPEIVFDEIYVDGTTTIFDLSILSPKSKEFTFITNSSVTFADGTTTLKLQGQFNSTPNSTLTLINNGTSWSEKSRAVV